MLIYEKNAGKKKLFAECTILSEPAGMRMILRDSGILFDVTDADSLPVSLRQYVVARMMVVHDKKAYLTTTGYNRIELFSAKMTTVETVVQLSKGNISSQNVRVEFSLEDMDMSRFQQGATYEQIQEWVQEKYGFHVTHLNIAKTKRKCGITERINYNLPKSENSKSPGTPKEKEEAIIDAFRHFQMI